MSCYYVLKFKVYIFVCINLYINETKMIFNTWRQSCPIFNEKYNILLLLTSLNLSCVALLTRFVFPTFASPTRITLQFPIGQYREEVELFNASVDLVDLIWYGIFILNFERYDLQNQLFKFDKYIQVSECVWQYWIT